MKPIVEAFVRNGSCYNMLHSGVLELLEYIRKVLHFSAAVSALQILFTWNGMEWFLSECYFLQENKTLTIYIFETFWDQLSKFQYLETIRSLKTRYEQVELLGAINASFIYSAYSLCLLPYPVPRVSF